MLANGKNKIKIHGNLRKSQFTKKPEEHSLKRPMNYIKNDDSHEKNTKLAEIYINYTKKKRIFPFPKQKVRHPIKKQVKICMKRYLKTKKQAKMFVISKSE